MRRQSESSVMGSADSTMPGGGRSRVGRWEEISTSRSLPESVVTTAVNAPRLPRSVRDVVVNGVRLRVEEEGSGRESVVFSHSLVADRRMFDAQVAALRDRYRCIRYDHRGHGESELPRETIVGVETVYDDAVALIEALDLAPCHWVGLSLGGLVGMRLAARRPDLLRSAVLLETPPAERERAVNRLQAGLSLAVLKVLGPRLAARVVLEPTMRRFYGSTFRRDPTRRNDYLAERADMARKIQITSPAVVWGVVNRASMPDQLSGIRIPTLVIVGDEDAAIPPDRAKRVASAIPQARFEIVHGAGHASTVDQPATVSALIADFLDGLPR